MGHCDDWCVATGWDSGSTVGVSRQLALEIADRRGGVDDCARLASYGDSGVSEGETNEGGVSKRECDERVGDGGGSE